MDKPWFPQQKVPFPSLHMGFPLCCPHLGAMDLSVIVLPTDAQDLACLQPAHQVGLAVLLHQRRGLLRRHGAGPAPPSPWLRGGTRRAQEADLLSHGILRRLGKIKQPPPQNLSVRPADGSSSSQGREPWQQGRPRLQVAHLRMILLSPGSAMWERKRKNSEQSGFSMDI